jgi:ubiquinone biosynthesis protein UbiJ
MGSSKKKKEKKRDFAVRSILVNIRQLALKFFWYPSESEVEAWKRQAAGSQCNKYLVHEQM